MEELAKPVSRGKKKASDQMIELAGEIKVAKEGFKGQVTKVTGLLDELLKRDIEIDWATLADGLFGFEVCYLSAVV